MEGTQVLLQIQTNARQIGHEASRQLREMLDREDSDQKLTSNGEIPDKLRTSAKRALLLAVDEIENDERR